MPHVLFNLNGHHQDSKFTSLVHKEARGRTKERTVFHLKDSILYPDGQLGKLPKLYGSQAPHL